ncbi:MAG TPA: MBL fold metallo-hydrolase [Planctomycetota bacterium]|jgi:phosphoribosyl 1,2-cyclic phosphate phosphodiesterase
MPKLSLEFLGSGTSVGVPTIGCNCAVCASTDSLNKRLRSSALVRGYDSDGTVATTVVIDTSADFRQQMLRSNVARLDGVVFTHHHADHVVGIDDVRRYNAIQQQVLGCWATAATIAGLKRGFGYVFGEDLNVRWGLPSLKPVVITPGVSFEIGCLRFEPLLLDHEVMATTGFRITCGDSAVLSYCVDVKRIPPETYERLKGTHTLVLDMLREKPHPTHMNLPEALAAIDRIAPQRTYFAHIAHEVDHRVLEARLPESIRLGYDGLVIELQ